MRWLLSGQATEELAHTDDSDPSRPTDDWHKYYLPGYTPAFNECARLRATGRLPMMAEELSGRHADDIPTPPPDC